jgi:asparagine synthase (glutamine-hydrolysing)
MCGICGTISRGGELLYEDSPRQMQAMLAALAHRGPDEQGVYETDLALLGARRLAIRGLDDGAQPMTDPETGIVAVCNGEIDNHIELRRWLASRGVNVPHATDVAIIPLLYREIGDAFLDRLVGAFALSIWDPRRERLLLARDRAGERPLFFRVDAGKAVFASELSALVLTSENPPPLDHAAIIGYLQSGSFTAPGTPFAGIEKVGPGEVVIVDTSGIHRRRWWRWRPGPRKTGQVTPGHFDAIFRQAVSRQTDVETSCGVFLSGGLDSSLVAAVARSVRPTLPLPVFTLRFAAESYDEGPFAEQVAERLGLEIHNVWVEPEDLQTRLAELVALAGEPLADPAWVPTALLSRRTAEDCKVVVVGEGGDELFGGYPTYLGARWSDRYARLPAVVRQGMESLIGALPPSEKKVTLSFLLKRFIAGAGHQGLERHRLWTSNLSPALLERIGVRANTSIVDPPGTAAELLDRLQLHDLETSLAEGLLTKADRAGTMSSLELRAPFLDRDVMELAAGLTASQRINGTVTKSFLKSYARRYLPRSIVHRRKRGLSVPLAAWLRGPLQDWARDRLTSKFLHAAGLESRSLLELLDEHRLRKADHARALWTVIVLSEWLEWVASSSGLTQRRKQLFARQAQQTAWQRPITSARRMSTFATPFR